MLKKFILTVILAVGYAVSGFCSASHDDGKCFTTLYLRCVNGNEVMISSGSDNGWIEDIYRGHTCGGDDHGYLTDWKNFPDGYYRLWYYWAEDIAYANRLIEKAGIIVMEYYKSTCLFLYNYIIFPKHAVDIIEYH